MYEPLDTGIVGIAVISAIFGQKDIEEATRKLREKTERLFSERM